MLDNPFVATCRFDKQAALPNIVGARFFDVDVFSGLAGQDGRWRVPMIRGGDDDGIQRVVGQDFSNVVARFDLFTRQFLAPFQSARVNIADPGQAYSGVRLKDTGEVRSASPAPNQCHGQSLFGICCAGVVNVGGEGQRGGCS